MTLNWFTVIAQLVNFLILVWLLKRFLYKPVLDAIDKRKKKIASRLEDAATQKAEAEKERQVFLQKNEDFDNERAAKMSTVHEDANSEKQRLIEEVRKETAELRSKYEDLFMQQKVEMAQTLKRKTKQEVFAIVEKMLGDLANGTMEEQIVKVFIKKVSDLDKENSSKLKNALTNYQKPIIIKSAFDLSSTSKLELEEVIEKTAGQQNTFQYQLEADLFGGIEISTETYQLSWNIESYLDLLKENSVTNENASFKLGQNN